MRLSPKWPFESHLDLIVGSFPISHEIRLWRCAQACGFREMAAPLFRDARCPWGLRRRPSHLHMLLSLGFQASLASLGAAKAFGYFAHFINKCVLMPSAWKLLPGNGIRVCSGESSVRAVATGEADRDLRGESRALGGPCKTPGGTRWEEARGR